MRNEGAEQNTVLLLLHVDGLIVHSLTFLILSIRQYDYFRSFVSCAAIWYDEDSVARMKLATSMKMLQVKRE
ncbi:hypothetical protein [Marinicrinis sediminis]|uniref:Uncharacterized protein n=1 Tax=Marinicrinis sediminis TaxID=1652465 RepID=A0ABW5RE89_9BACL